MKKLFILIAACAAMSSCIDTPEERGVYPAVVKIIGTPIVKTTMVDTLLGVGDTIEVRHRDTLALSIIVR